MGDIAEKHGQKGCDMTVQVVSTLSRVTSHSRKLASK